MNRIGPILISIGALAVIVASSPAPAPAPTRRRKGKRKRRGQGGYITKSTRDKHETVRESPAQLLAQARKRVPGITLEEMTAARLIASEHGSGTETEWAAIVDAELNRAESKGKPLTDHLTSAGTYGKQGGRYGKGKKRPASTRKDPTRAHLRIARRVLSGELRGVSKGAHRFFDPVSQMSSHKKWIRGESKHRHCHPAIIIERWTHAKEWLHPKGRSCALRKKSGRSLQEWVGPIDGIDPMRVMLLRPAKPGEEHKRRYREARRLILERYPLPRKGKGILTL